MRYLLTVLLILPLGCADRDVESESLLTTSSPTETTPRPITFMGFRAAPTVLAAWANDLPLVTEEGRQLYVTAKEGSGSHGRYIGGGAYAFSFRTESDNLDSEVDSTIVVDEGDAAAIALIDTSAGPGALAFVHQRPAGLADDQLALKFINVRNDQAAVDLYQCATRGETLGKLPDCELLAAGLAFAQPWQQVLTIDEHTQFAVEGPDGFERLPLAPRASPNGPPEPSFAAIYYHDVYGVQFYGDDPQPF